MEVAKAVVMPATVAASVEVSGAATKAVIMEVAEEATIMVPEGWRRWQQWRWQRRQ